MRAHPRAVRIDASGVTLKTPLSFTRYDFLEIEMATIRAALEEESNTPLLELMANLERAFEYESMIDTVLISSGLSPRIESVSSIEVLELEGGAL